MTKIKFVDLVIFFTFKWIPALGAGLFFWWNVLEVLRVILNYLMPTPHVPS